MMTAPPHTEFPLLIGDIGGTNARLAILEAPGSPMVPLARTLTTTHPDPTAAIRSALDTYGGAQPRSALLALACRVEGPIAHLHNAGWTLDAGEVGLEFGLRSVSLVNDFVPVAAAVSVLERKPDHLLPIGPEIAEGPGPRVVLGPGTGLGAAALLPFGERFMILSTEAGHVDFGPATDDETAVWPFLDRIEDRVSAEAVLSGPGLLRVYRALAASQRLPATCDSPNAITGAGIEGTEKLATDALRLFARLLGRFAADLTVTFGATGVYIAGGIAPKIATILAEGDFRAAFQRKQPFDHWMKAVPTFMIADSDPALTGLCAIVAHPERFIYAFSGWRR